MTTCNVKTDAVTMHELYCLLMRSVWICSNSHNCENDWICDICSVLCSVLTRSGITACTSRRSSTLSLFPPPLTSSSPPPTTEPSVYGTFVKSKRTVPPPSSLTKHQPLLIQVCMLSVESLRAAQCRMVRVCGAICCT